jgi:hypothetical protein
MSELELLPPVEGTSEDLGATVFQEEPEPSWILPNSWFQSPVWEQSLELGINGSEGNAQAISMVAASKLKRETEGNILGIDITYGKTASRGIETQHYALGNSRWDWKFTPAWLLYQKSAVEYDEFKAFDLRLALSGGMGYHLFKTDQTQFTGRFGAGVSHEFGGPDESWVPEANFGLDFEHSLNDRQKVVMTSDYYPSWEDYHDYRVVTNACWQLILADDSNLSLKIGAIDRYDSTPNGARFNDIDYYLALIWKL